MFLFSYACTEEEKHTNVFQEHRVTTIFRINGSGHIVVWPSFCVFNYFLCVCRLGAMGCRKSPMMPKMKISQRKARAFGINISLVL